MTKKTGRRKHGLWGSFIILLLLALVAAYTFFDAQSLLHPQEAAARTVTQEQHLQVRLNELFPLRNSPRLSPLPYAVTPVELDINAKSAIIIDTATGSIIYEKNADEPIPPASMTKLVEMYVIFKAVEQKEISLDDVVPLPPQSWAVNLPSDASRMYLGQGQIVTLRELLLGLAIASGNDASIAVAYYVCGNMEDFVERMNAVVRSLGLTKTHFVESSGYSELNMTTAREFATFARVYVNTYPQALRQFHAKNMLRYPLAQNLPQDQKRLGDSLAITQYNTNVLLSKLTGCDGLKTGFIDESGYNISVTAIRNNTRFLSVTMGGPGHSTREGNSYRLADNLALFDYAYGSFADYRAPQGRDAHEYSIGLAGAKERSIRLVPAVDETMTVPYMTGDSPNESVRAVTVQVDMPPCLYGEISCGHSYGSISYRLQDATLRTIPLVADRDVAQDGIVQRIAGRLSYECARVLARIER